MEAQHCNVVLQDPHRTQRTRDPHEHIDTRKCQELIKGRDVERMQYGTNKRRPSFVLDVCFLLELHELCELHGRCCSDFEQLLNTVALCSVNSFQIHPAAMPESQCYRNIAIWTHYSVYFTSL